MNKTLLVLKREYFSRIKKKSFLLMTIITPLIIPTLMGGLIYFAIQQKDSKKDTIYVVDESKRLEFKNSRNYEYITLDSDLESAKTVYQESDAFALIYIPDFGIENPAGFTIYSGGNPSINILNSIEWDIEKQIEQIKIQESGLDSTIVANLKTDVSLRSINLSESGEESVSSSKATFWIGYLGGFIIYIFIFIYGGQIMQGVIEEKNSKIVEIIISSVKPFQLMMGKVLGIASVGLSQILIWILLISVLSSGILAYFGISHPSTMAVEQMTQNIPQEEIQAQASQMQEIAEIVYSIPYAYIAITFIFYFIGGYLLYGALFAAVGSAVDSLAEAQQFTFPISVPLLIAIFGLFIFILEDPNSSGSFWLSMIPFTSPVAMMGRIPFGVPVWELVLSMVLLIAGFVFTIWMAGRIYRVGILMQGTKVSYKTLFKWFMMDH